MEIFFRNRKHMYSRYIKIPTLELTSVNTVKEETPVSTYIVQSPDINPTACDSLSKSYNKTRNKSTKQL